jgi:hypothetical protein
MQLATVVNVDRHSKAAQLLLNFFRAETVLGLVPRAAAVEVKRDGVPRAARPVVVAIMTTVIVAIPITIVAAAAAIAVTVAVAIPMFMTIIVVSERGRKIRSRKRGGGNDNSSKQFHAVISKLFLLTLGLAFLPRISANSRS